MALKLYERYPQLWESPSNDYPQGAFKNLSAQGETDGSYLEKDWLNDYSGFFGALLRNAEMTPNGTIDTAQRSQFYDALVKVAKGAVADEGYATKTYVDNKFNEVPKTEIINDWDQASDENVFSAGFVKDRVVNEWGDSPEKVLSQEFLYDNKLLTPTIDDISVEQALSGNYAVNLLGRTIVSNEKPVKNIGFNGFIKHGSISYPQKDTLNMTASKITDMKGYTAWAQDKAYVLCHQIKVWVNHGDAHLDGQLTPAYIISEDGGSSWSELILPFGLKLGYTTWCAGYDGEYEYVVVRRESDLTNTLFRRTVNFNGSYNEYRSWEELPMNLPRPSEATDPENRLIMIHSFTRGRGGSIVVGAHYGSQWVGGFQSFDKGLSWSYFTLSTSSVRSEPTIKYDEATNKYYGFIRNGSATGNPMFFSGEELNSTLNYTAPTGMFGAPMSSTPVPLYVENGKIHAFVGFRNGTLEGVDDYSASQFLITADISKGNNIWSHCDIIRLGATTHIELGGASALSVGSVLRFGNKLMIYTGSEERTGTSPNPSTDARVNRIANIIQFSLELFETGEVVNDLNVLKDMRANTSCTMTMNNGNVVQPIGLPVFRRFKDLNNAGLDAANNNSNNFIIDFGSSSGAVSSWSTGSYVSYLGNESGLRIDVTSNTPQIINKEYGLLYSFRALGIVPRSDGASDIGIAGTAFNTIHLRNQPVITSDSRRKKNISNISEKYLRVIESLEIKSFNFVDIDTKTHFGIIAQDWIKACKDCGIDPHESGVLVGDEKTGYAIRYGELQNLFNAYILHKLNS